tara:strand:+ start:1086 stop:1676 length:591 start_codon:yes stop_codon:yes gene_type:complete
MFSGIIENRGFVVKFEKKNDYRLVLDTDLKYTDVKKGSSVCCNGICLTVVSKKKKKNHTQLSFDVSEETIKCSNYNTIKKGDEINIEKSLRVGDEISGHFVFGHVDDTSKLISIKKIGASHEIKLEISKNNQKFIAKKGSISLNGVSLTVNQIKNNIIVLNIIPFTWLNTNMKGLKIGDRINLEVDMLARYVTRNH